MATDKWPPKVKFSEVWASSPVLQQAFTEAKQMLEEAVELGHPDPNLPLALFSDASDLSVGGSLQMMQPDGSYKPLGYYSAHLNETQKKYSVFKKELLAAFKSLRHFLPEIYGKHVTIWTDHLPLQQAFQNNNLPLNDPQTYRQITEIGRFTRDVRYVQGVQNVFADFLSRIPENKKGTAYLDTPEEVASTETVKMQLVSLQVLQDLQESCPEVTKIKNNDKPKNTIFEEVDLDGIKVWCEVTNPQPRPYVPFPLRDQIMTSLHSLDHLGWKSSVKRIATDYYWPTLRNDVKDFVKMCVACNRAKANTK